MSTAAVQLNDEMVNGTPDAESGGSPFLDGLEQTALDSIDVLSAGAAARIAGGNGRLPFDPANPNFGGLPRGSAGTVTSAPNGGTLLIVILILWVIFG